MLKRFITFIIPLILSLGLIGGCGGEKKEPAQEKKVAKSKAVEEVESAAEEEAPSPEYPTNAPPKIISARIVPEPAYATNDLSVEVESEDRESDLVTYTYQWMKAKEGGSAEGGEDLEGETEPTLFHDNFARGDALAVKITPFDGRSNGQTYRTRYTVIANSPPKIVSQPPDIVPDKSTYTYQIEVEDPDDDPITFSLSEGAPAGMTIDSTTGLITWPITGQSVGTYDISINVDDSHQGICSQHYSLTLEYKQIMPEE